jgi:hypothetical protein
MLPSGLSSLFFVPLEHQHGQSGAILAIREEVCRRVRQNSEPKAHLNRTARAVAVIAAAYRHCSMRVSGIFEDGLRNVATFSNSSSGNRRLFKIEIIPGR